MKNLALGSWRSRNLLLGRVREGLLDLPAIIRRAASKGSGEGEDETAISLPGNCKALSLKMQPAHPIYEMAEAVATSNSKRRWQWPLT